MIITITGDLAGGKSSVAKRIASSIGAAYESAGSIQRQIAAMRGMTTLELNKYAETHPEIDKEVDNRVKAFGSSTSAIVVDSRMAWHFIPQSLKIYIAVSSHRAAERVMRDQLRTGEPVYSDLEDAARKLLERKASEELRYKALYGADSSVIENFDLYIDTTWATPDDVFELLSERIAAEEGNRQTCEVWLSPKLILPMGDAKCLVSGATPGDSNNTPVPVVRCGDYFYAWDQHELLGAAIQNKTPFIGAAILQGDDLPTPGLSAQQYVDSTFRLTTVHDWEKALGVAYIKPDGVGSGDRPT
ncbi:MAG: AAA family ATPase [Gammaproteobacteria bacterium]|nr:AAA family ATPase [Gammaproteobacteria bacterium]